MKASPESDVARLRSVIKKRDTRIRDLEAMVEKLSDYVNTANGIIADSPDFDDADHEDAHNLVNEARRMIGLEELPNLMEDQYIHNLDEDDEDYLPQKILVINPETGEERIVTLSTEKVEDEDFNEKDYVRYEGNSACFDGEVGREVDDED